MIQRSEFTFLFHEGFPVIHWSFRGDPSQPQSGAAVKIRESPNSWDRQAATLILQNYYATDWYLKILMVASIFWYVHSLLRTVCITATVRPRSVHLPRRVKKKQMWVLHRTAQLRKWTALFGASEFAWSFGQECGRSRHCSWRHVTWSGGTIGSRIVVPRSEMKCKPQTSSFSINSSHRYLMTLHFARNNVTSDRIEKLHFARNDVTSDRIEKQHVIQWSQRKKWKY